MVKYRATFNKNKTQRPKRYTVYKSHKKLIYLPKLNIFDVACDLQLLSLTEPSRTLPPYEACFGITKSNTTTD